LDRAGAKYSHDQPTSVQSLQNKATGTNYAEHGEAGKVGLQNITCVHRGNSVFSKTPVQYLC
jgi:hypothetical protein